MIKAARTMSLPEAGPSGARHVPVLRPQVVTMRGLWYSAFHADCTEAYAVRVHKLRFLYPHPGPAGQGGWQYNHGVSQTRCANI